MFPFVSHRGVLGLNARSLLYIRPFNPRKATALADSKLKTKAYLAARGVPVARIYAKIETRNHARVFDFRQLPNECVLKPNAGFGGEGIIILKGRNRSGEYLRNGKVPIGEKELREHIEDILDGKFSITGQRDTAFFEQILVPHECFDRFRPAGLPDIRVIVFNLVPVMAMLRIPTAESEGRANIHLGGIGIGIDIAKGVTTHAAQYHSLIDKLPHGESPSGHLIPYWDDILLVCSRIQQITNIGYLACDITIDREMGPALLEVNARAGLTVQIANLAPLRKRLERVEGLKTVDSPEKGVRIGQDLFGSKQKSRGKRAQRERTGEKPTLGLRELIDIILGEGASLEVSAKIESGETRSIFSPDLITELLQRGGAEPAEEEETYRVKFTLGGKKIQTVVTSGKTGSDVRAIVGTRDLKGFLIDPAKKEEVRKAVSTVKTDLRAIDRQFAQIDGEFLILRHLKPINLLEEIERLRIDPLHNPTFLYAGLPENFDEVEEKLQIRVQDDSPLGILLEKKREKLLMRFALFRARSDDKAFTDASVKLFGAPTKDLLRAASDEIAGRAACDLPPPDWEKLSAAMAAKQVEESLAAYSLHNWTVSVRPRLVADCTVGGSTVYLRADATFTKEEIASLIAHEIETHALTAENGDHQPYQILRRGTAGYLDTQEGLAIVNQNDILSPFSEKRFNPPRNLLGLQFSLSHSFAETRSYLEKELGYTPQKALSQSIAMKRGLSDTSQPGGFTKSIVYFRGKKIVEDFLRKGGDLRRLYIGKVSIEDLELIERLPDLKPPLILPLHLRAT